MARITACAPAAPRARSTRVPIPSPRRPGSSGNRCSAFGHHTRQPGEDIATGGAGGTRISRFMASANLSGASGSHQSSSPRTVIADRAADRHRQHPRRRTGRRDRARAARRHGPPRVPAAPRPAAFSRIGSVTRSAGVQPRAAAIRFSQGSDTVRVPISSRPIVCGVVGGEQARATSSRVMPLARRTSRIAVNHSPLSSPFRLPARLPGPSIWRTRSSSAKRHILSCRSYRHAVRDRQMSWFGQRFPDDRCARTCR